MISEICGIPPCPPKTLPARPVYVYALAVLRGRVWKCKRICVHTSADTLFYRLDVGSGFIFVCVAQTTAGLFFVEIKHLLFRTKCRRSCLHQQPWLAGGFLPGVRERERLTGGVLKTSDTVIINPADLWYSSSWTVRPMCGPFEPSVIATIARRAPSHSASGQVSGQPPAKSCSDHSFTHRSLQLDRQQGTPGGACG